MISRRNLIVGLGAGTGSLLLSGCDRLGEAPRFQSLLDLGEKLTYRVQRGLTDRTALAAEFSAADLSPVFRSNGNTMPRSIPYRQHLASNFRDWRLVIDGLVGNPLSLSLADLRRHDRHDLCHYGPLGTACNDRAFSRMRTTNWTTTML